MKLPYYNTPDFTPQFYTSDKDATENITHQIAAFGMTDQHGNKITDADIEGKIHIANFIFTRCGSICPVMTKHMKMVQEVFKNNNEVVMLSFSVTPWMDTVSRLKQYAEENAITANNWHLLTGSKSEIYTLARQSYFAEEDLGFSKDSTDFLHTEHILLVDKSKRIRGIYNGTLQLEIEQLIEDINTLKSDTTNQSER
ncbi:SCO family protein [Dyadobacter tibetensis]|uniref:SCO family protein n=1 Tax=Dyadobacter tibetensis TaxID=1211851 RepID=UPI0004AE346D|nr:SCO family protein [Dyadobacter tibetensis]